MRDGRWSLRRVPIALTAMSIVAMVVSMLVGCAGVSSIQHPMIVANNTCEFDIARAGKYPWQAQQCLTICRSDKGELAYFAGCSSESLLSEVKGATGIIPTAPVW